jgi:hypothetical protein
MRCAGHESVAGGDEEQQREAQLQDEAQQREAQQLEEKQQREVLRVLASGAERRAGAATAAATTNEAAEGACDGPVPKQAAAAADAGALGKRSFQHEHQTTDWRPMGGEHAGIDTNNRRQLAAHGRGKRSFQH